VLGGLPLPLAHLVGVHPVLAGDLVECLCPLDGFDGHPGLVGRVKSATV
jgi:hypothetical protein